MDSKQIISSFFKILLLYEDVNNPRSEVTEQDYITYLNRQYVRFLGSGVSEVYNLIKGLQTLGMSAEHSVVKTIVFHLIDLTKKGVFQDAT